MSKKEKDKSEDVLNDVFSEGAEIEEKVEDTNGQHENESNEMGRNAKLKEELEAQKDKYLRLAAEFDNFRKRTSREILDIRQTASRDLITSLLEVLDDIDRAETTINESAEKNELTEGISLIFNKFRKILEQRGLRAIDTMHTDFDVEKDEAISEMPVEDENLKGKVVAEVQKGYTLNDKLIRFAKVVVGK